MSLPNLCERHRVRTQFELRAARADAPPEILIYREIGETWAMDGLTAGAFRSLLDGLSDVPELVVRINSPGGSVWDGLAIYNALLEHPARVTVRVDALAASIASVIAMAGDQIIMGRGAQMMIHDPWQLAIGNAEQLRKAADVLEQVGEGLVDAYAKRTRAPRAQLAEWMAAETWFNAAEAVKHGFADETLDETDDDALRLAAKFTSPHFKFPERIAAMSQSPAPTAPVPAEIEAAALEARRVASIRDYFAAPFGGRNESLGSRFPDLFARALTDHALDVAGVSRLVLAKLGEGVEPLGAAADVRGSSSGVDFVAAATDALAMRAGVRVDNPHAATRDVRTMSTLDIARTCLSQSGRPSRDLSGMRLIKAAMTTSDFPSILENTLGKVLRAGYESDTQSHAIWVKRSTVRDFKAVSRVLLGSAPALAAVPEGTEYTYGGLTENKASLQIGKYGKALCLTWETLINDDLQVFARVPAAMGAAARRAEADAVYALFTANSGAGQTMQDSANLFDAAHANVSSTVGAISTPTLGAARSLLRKQLALGGGYLNLNPRFLIVPAESETLAEQVMAQATRHVTDTVSTNTRKLDAPTPEWISRLQLVVEPRLNASYGFYVAAGSDQIDHCELATLEAEPAPVLEEERGFDIDANNYKVRHSFVAKFIDWKGIVRVPTT